jgi:hypothetical protein
MPIQGLTPEDIKANIRAARERKEAALAEYEEAKAELAWWEQGLRLFDPKAARALDGGQDAEAVVTELFPEGFVFDNGTDPTLRQAIVVVMRENPGHPHWSITDLATALSARGWLPSREDPRDARKRISDMAGIMYDSGQLARVGRGVYKLSPPLTAALDAAGGGQK